jgi:hypothetical protein
MELLIAGFCSATALHGSVALPFCHPDRSASEVEGSAVQPTFTGPAVRKRSVEFTFAEKFGSVFGRFFIYVIDDQHGRRTPLLLQFQPELLADGIE